MKRGKEESQSKNEKEKEESKLILGKYLKIADLAILLKNTEFGTKSV